MRLNRIKSQNTIKKIAAVLCIAVELLCLPSCQPAETSTEPAEQSFKGFPVIRADDTRKTAVENSAMRMQVDPSDASVYIECRNTGRQYPLAVEQESMPESLDGGQKMLLGSMLQVTACDAMGKEFVVNSRVGSVNRGTFAIYECGDGIIINYRFERPSDQYEIPVRIRLTADGFTIEVLYEDIREWGEMRVNRIAVLPAFEAQLPDCEGYMLIPDGSGALVPWGASQRNTADYYGDIYGRDPALSLVMQTEVRQEVRLPVFGGKAGNAAFLGIVTAGEAGAAIHCSPAKQEGQFGCVYASFVYRQADTSVLADRDWNSRRVTVLADQPFEESPCVRYCLLPPEEADYSGMAVRYRRYLQEECGLGRHAEEPTVLLEMAGAYAEKESVLGLTLEQSKPATTFQQARTILEEFAGEGIADLSVVYTSVNEKGRYRSKAGVFRPDAVLGGQKGLQTLAAYCREANIPLMPEIDVFSHYAKKSALSLDRFAKRINEEPVKVYRYSPATNQTEEDLFRYLTRPSNWLADWQNMLKACRKADISSVAAAGFGDLLYADHTGKSPKNRDAMRQEVTSLAEAVTGEGMRLMVGGGNAYMLAYASGVRDVPVSSSAFDLQSRSVPFYAMVMHGLLPLYSESLTGKSDLKSWCLTLAETGVMPQFLVTGSPSTAFLNTEQNETYASYYKDVLKDVKEMAGWLLPILKQTWDQTIVRHERVGMLSVTEYENGGKTVTNFGQEDLLYENIAIPARSSQWIPA